MPVVRRGAGRVGGRASAAGADGGGKGCGAGSAQVTVPSVQGDACAAAGVVPAAPGRCGDSDRGGAGGGGAGDGHRRIAVRLGRSASTVRGWLRRFAGRAEPVRVFFTVLLARVAPDPVMPAGAVSAVAAAVSAIAGAAMAVTERWPLVGQVPVWAAASAASGGLLLAPGWPGGGRNTS